MFGMKFYDQGSQEELNENSNTIFIINDENNVTDELSNNDLELKKECFNKWKNSDSEKCDEKNIHCNQRNCDFFNNDCNQCKKSYNNEEEKLNEDDCDEDVSDKLYIISMDGIPYYYENDLVSARSKMWTIANNLLRKDSSLVHDDFENNTNYIFTNNLNKVSLISPYNFFGLNYHHTICELQIDYVVRYNN